VGAAPRYMGFMESRETLQKAWATLRGWLKLTEVRTLLPIFLIAMAGPLGEAIDVGMFLTLEAEIIAFDLGLEVVSSILIFGYRLVLVILAAMALASLGTIFAREEWICVPALVSCGSRRIEKIPIH